VGASKLEGGIVCREKALRGILEGEARVRGELLGKLGLAVDGSGSDLGWTGWSLLCNGKKLTLWTE
jgi:hypothetical protein